jgi:hypothetical protein
MQATQVFLHLPQLCRQVPRKHHVVDVAALLRPLQMHQHQSRDQMHPRNLQDHVVAVDAPAHPKTLNQLALVKKTPLWTQMVILKMASVTAVTVTVTVTVVPVMIVQTETPPIMAQNPAVKSVTNAITATITTVAIITAVAVVWATMSNQKFSKMMF